MSQRFIKFRFNAYLRDHTNKKCVKYSLCAMGREKDLIKKYIERVRRNVRHG